MTSTRLLALDALVRIEDGAYAHVVLPVMLRRSGLDDRDRAFVTDLVYGTVRAQRRLDDLVTRVARRPVHRLDPPVRAALRLGAFQLEHGVPPYAAVGETVRAVAARSPRARSFVNAALRAMARLGPPFPEPDDDGVALSYPAWIVELLARDLGATDAPVALDAMNEPAALTLRVNPTRADVADVRAALDRAGAHHEPGKLVPGALVVRGGGDPARLAPVRDGWATPQDQASQAVVAILDPRRGDRVADVAAAPGGKSGAIAERVGASGLVAAFDVDAGRVRLVAQHATRLGLGWLFPVVADGRALPARAATFDRVLLDAPCSGLGVLRRRPDARWRLSPQAIDGLAALQRALLGAAAALVCPGGRLVYSVCTLTTAETIDIDRWASGELAGFDAEPSPPAPWSPHGRGALLLPQSAGTDGMYVLALTRTGGGPRDAPSRAIG